MGLMQGSGESISAHVVGFQYQMFAVASLIFLLAEGVILWSILRRGPKPQRAGGSALLEFAWSVIPVALFALVGVITYRNAGRGVQEAIHRSAAPTRVGMAEPLALRPPGVVQGPEGVVR
jgi:heme/copper-type cytochrome/quinol oxidase subunit 2